MAELYRQFSYLSLYVLSPKEKASFDLLRRCVKGITIAVIIT